MFILQTCRYDKAISDKTNIEICHWCKLMKALKLQADNDGLFSCSAHF